MSGAALDLRPLVGPRLACGEFYAVACCRFRSRPCDCLCCCVFDCPWTLAARREWAARRAGGES